MTAQALKPDYDQRLQAIEAAIQESDELATYLDSEEAEDYAALKEAYEPHIAELYEGVAAADPLQLEALELKLLDAGFEGLYMPKVLGFATLRPLVNDRGQYYRPQQHLREVLLAIAGSSAFPELERRIGQGLTVAFALSTHVWVTNLIDEIPNKIPRNFFRDHNDTSLRTPEQRLAVRARYARQFRDENYASTTFPADAVELSSTARELETFLRMRFGNPELDNSALVEPVRQLLADEQVGTTPQSERIVALIAMYMELPSDMENALRTRLRTLAGDEAFAERAFGFLAELHHDDAIDVGPEVDRRMSLRVGTSGDTKLSSYFNLATTIHDEGIDALETQDAIRLFQREQEQTSEVNECVRQTLLRYIRERIAELDVETYTDFFEVTKLFAVYFDIFRNEAFKQEVRGLSVGFVKQLMKRYTDKRGRDYQDIKKFVKTTFLDLGFMTERELTNFFKTKRKRRPRATA